MRDAFFKRAMALAALSALAACSGGGGSSTIPGGSTPAGSGGSATTQSATVKVQLTISNTSSSTNSSSRSTAARRNPKFVSPSTLGLVAYAYNPTATSSTESETLANVDPTSPLCVAQTGGAPGSQSSPIVGPRVCTFTLAAPVGSDSIQILTYDATQTKDPSGETFTTFSGPPPKNSGNELGSGITQQTVSAASANTISVVISGVPATIALVPIYASGDGSQSDSYVLGVSEIDADGSTIIAGATDGFTTALPAVLTNVEGTTSGFSQLSILDGVSNTSSTGSLGLNQNQQCTSTVGIKHSSDRLTVNYVPGPPTNCTSSQLTSGSRGAQASRKAQQMASSPPYYATIAVAAPLHTTTTTAYFTPAFVIDPSDDAAFNQNGPDGYPVVSLTAGSSYTLDATEAFNSGGLLGFNSASVGCAGVVSVSQGSTASTSSVVSSPFTLTGGTTPSGRNTATSPSGPPPCILTFTDNFGTTAKLEVVNSPTTTSKAPGFLVAPNMLLAAQGNANSPGVQYYGFTPNVVPSSPASDLNTALSISQTPQPFDVGFDRSGTYRMYTTDGTTLWVNGFNPANNAFGGTVAVSTSLTNPESIAVDPSGSVYVAEASTATPAIALFAAPVPAGKNPTPLLLNGGQGSFKDPQSVAVDNAGDVFVSDAGTSTIYEFTSSQFSSSTTAVAVPVQTITAPAGNITALAVDSSGGLYAAQSKPAGGVIVNTFSISNATYSGPFAISDTASSCSEINGLTVDGKHDIFASCDNGSTTYDIINWVYVPSGQNAGYNEIVVPQTYKAFGLAVYP